VRGTRKQLVVVASAIAAIAALITGGLFIASGASASTPNPPDQIVYSQQNGKNGDYLKYIPGDPSKPTISQSVVGNSGCANSFPTANSVLALTGNFYANGDYTTTPTPANGSTFNNRTGVCHTPQNWSIEIGEGLDFAPGANAATTGRHWQSVSLVLEREDKIAGNAIVQIAFFNNNVLVTTQQIPLGQNVGTQTTFNSQPVAGGFDRVEVQLPAALEPGAGTSISVVGPTSTFVFENTFCSGQTINSASADGTVTAGITLQSAGCKEYASFTSATISQGIYTKSITFDSPQSAGAHVTTVFDFFDANCNANGSTANGLSPCPATQVDFGTGFQDETFCGVDSSLSPPAAVHPNNIPWCVTERDVSYTSSNGVVTAHVHELWDGFGDVGWHG
jgi:hypothetical protein